MIQYKNTIHTYIHTYIHSSSKIMCVIWNRHYTCVQCTMNNNDLFPKRALWPCDCYFNSYAGSYRTASLYTMQPPCTPCSLPVHHAASLCTVQPLCAPCSLPVHRAASLCTVQPPCAVCSLPVQHTASLCSMQPPCVACSLLVHRAEVRRYIIHNALYMCVTRPTTLLDLLEQFTPSPVNPAWH